MDLWIKINSQTNGKDKITRLLQYVSRLLWYYVESRKKLRDFVSRLQILENTLSSFRKCKVFFLRNEMLRFGQFVEVFYGTFKTIHLKDPALRITTTFSRIYTSFFIFFDNLIFLSKTGIIKVKNNNWLKYANQFWLGSILFNLLRDLYEIRLILNSKNLNNYRIYSKNLKNIQQLIPRTQSFLIFIELHSDIVLDTIKNVCDLWLPLTSLGKTKLSPGQIGFLGAISSICGILGIVNPLLKINPT